MSSYYCPTCGRYRNVVLTYKPVLFDVENATLSYSEIMACCSKCETPLPMPRLDDINADLREIVAEINK